jgi:hypothetical protein
VYGRAEGCRRALLLQIEAFTAACERAADLLRVGSA